MIRICLWAFLLVFGAFNIYVVGHSGFASVFPPFAALSQTQMFVDLSVALSLVCVWIVNDCRQAQRPPYVAVLFVAATAFFGSMGPLCYLLFRDFAEPSARP